MPKFAQIFIACVGLLFALGGCGESGPALFPATGAVTFEGKAVDGASVTFVSTDGQFAFATTDGSGKFSLSTRGKPGLAPGDYKVLVVKDAASGPAKTVTADDLVKMQKDAGGSAPKTESLLPKKYSSADSTDLTATVTTDKAKNNFTFDLKP